MFCPQCGSQVPDGSAFCAQCGAKMQAPAAPAGNATVPGMGKGPVFGGGAQPFGAGAQTFGAGVVNLSGGAFNPLRIAAMVALVVALIFSLLPWYTSSQEAVTGSSYASAGAGLLSDLTGSSYSLPKFEETYSVFQFGSLASTASTYLNAQKQLLNALEDWTAEASGRAHVVGIANPQYADAGPAGSLLAVLVGWIIAAIVSVAGLVRAFVTRGKGGLILVVGSALLALVAFGWSLIAYGGLVSERIAAAGGATNATICGVACLAAIVCVALSRTAKV